jgi:hypothetical protein
MHRNPTSAAVGASKYVSPAIESRRLRLNYDRLKRRLTSLEGCDGAEAEAVELRDRVDHIAWELGSIHANSVKAVESKLKVALDLADGRIGRISHRLFASAVSDLHYLALLSEDT